MNTIEFKNYNLRIKLTSFINIIGPPGSGKTTLLKMLINKIDNSALYINDKPISNYSTDYKKRNLTVCFNDLTFNTEYVNEELLYYQDILNIETSSSYQEIKAIEKYFNLSEILETKINYLSTAEKALIKILSLLIVKPAILGIDTLLSYCTIENKEKIVRYAKKNGITILNVTSSSEELLLGTDIIILNNHSVLEYNKTKKILEQEKLLKEIGFELPFIISISNGLNYYEVINKTYYNNKSLIGDIWK